MAARKWISVEDTRLLMQSRTVGEREEWHPVAQVTLRQIYPEVPPMYYGWWCTAEQHSIVKSETLIGAMTAVEAAVEAGYGG